MEKDGEKLCFINMQIKALWDCPDQDEEVGAMHIAEAIPPLASEPRELLEDPRVANLTGVDANTKNSEDSS